MIATSGATYNNLTVRGGGGGSGGTYAGGSGGSNGGGGGDALLNGQGYDFTVTGNVGVIGGNGGNSLGGAGGAASITNVNKLNIGGTLAVTSGEAGSASGGAAGAAILTAGTLVAPTINLTKNSGAQTFTVGTLAIESGNTLSLAGNPTVNISAYDFDLTGTGNGSTILAVSGGSLSVVSLNSARIKLTGIPGGLAIGDTITLISNVSGTITPFQTTIGGYTFDIKVVNGALVAVAAIPIALPQSPLPKMGDAFPLWQLLAVMGVAMVGMGWLGYRMRTRKSKA